MTRRAEFLPLRKTLRDRSADLRTTLAREIASLCDSKAADSTSDSVDIAFETSSGEMSSRLAERDVLELRQIERALERLRQGAYGICEKCRNKIRHARLKALPYATLCTGCERDMELHAESQDQWGTGDWRQVFDWEEDLQHQQTTLSELTDGLCGKKSR
jgi:DnaK suppressor protein